MLFAAATALLFLVSSGFQLQAANSRWITHGNGSGFSQLSIEDHAFDYFLSQEPFIAIPGTSVPFGIGMLIQAAGVLCLVACLLAMQPPTARLRRILQFGLGFIAALGTAMICYQALRTGLDGVPFTPLSASGLAIAVYLAATVALIALCLSSPVNWPYFGVSFFCLLGTTIPGYLVTYLIIAPAVLSYGSHDTTPGTETLLAVSTGLAGLAMLLALAAIVFRGKRAEALASRAA